MSSWRLDPAKGDYILVGGAPEQDESLLTPAYIRLKSPRRAWMYAPNQRYGSDFYLAQQRVTRVSLIEQMAKSALSPMIDDKRARSVTALTTEARRGAIGMEVTIVDEKGTVEQLDFNPIGKG